MLSNLVIEDRTIFSFQIVEAGVQGYQSYYVDGNIIHLYYINSVIFQFDVLSLINICYRLASIGYVCFGRTGCYIIGTFNLRYINGKFVRIGYAGARSLIT